MQDSIKLTKKRKRNLTFTPTGPGTYKFLNLNQEVIYIGKAKNLRQRIKSYFVSSSTQSLKVQRLINETLYLQLIVTTSELEALLLEQHLIKELKPKYNAQFKDDKGYPLITLEQSKDFPAIKSYLGVKKSKDKYYGPFPSSHSVKESLTVIQKTFKLRNCSDSFFKNRTRPCIQFQIGKCSAPCVGFISKEDYLKDVKATEMLLEGKGEALLSHFYEQMDNLSKNRSYERAAVFRDKISALRDVQRSQSATGFLKERDAISLCSKNGEVRIGVTSVRGGWMVKHQNFIQQKEEIKDVALEAFILNHYSNKDYCPKAIIVQGKLGDIRSIERLLTKKHKKSIRLITKPGKKDKGLLEICESNTELSLQKVLRKRRDLTLSFRFLQEEIGLSKTIRSIECIDISHHSGDNAVGGCVVFNTKGKLSKLSRIYNIDQKNAGNDIASIKEVVSRRFGKQHLQLRDLPSLLIVDGGYTHLKAVKKELDFLKIKAISLVSISKGARRKTNFDSIHKEDGTIIRVKMGSSAHLLIQEIRDETHRHSITHQRKKQSRALTKSSLDHIHGVGIKKKRSLIRYFGGLEGITTASNQDLLQVSGIGKKLADLIFDYFN